MKSYHASLVLATCLALTGAVPAAAFTSNSGMRHAPSPGTTHSPTPVVSAQQSKGTRREQSQFSMEEAPGRAVKTPKGVLRVLQREISRWNLKSPPKSAGELASWVVAAEVSLNGDGLPDLIVKGAGPLLGANVTPFWVFRRARRGYRLVLSDTAHGLTVLGTRTNGHRDIRLNAMTAAYLYVDTYRFNGSKYTLRWSRREPI